MQSIFIKSCCKNFRFTLFGDAWTILRKNVTKPTPILNCHHKYHTTQSEFKRINPSYNTDISQTFVHFKILRLIKLAIREQGPILKQNKKLEAALKKAEECNVSSDFINFAMRISVDTRVKAGIYEMLYFNHGHFVIQYEDIDNYAIKQHLLQICDKYDGHIIVGKVKWDEYFNPKGIISVEHKASQPITNEQEAEKIASKIGAELVRKELDINGWISWRFYCEPEDLHKTKQLLLKDNYEIEEAYVGLLPKRKVTLPGATKKSTHSIICKISEIPTVDNLFTNIPL